MRRLVILFMLLSIPAFGADNFLEGFTFNARTGLVSGAQLDDLVTQARFTQQASSTSNTNALFDGASITTKLSGVTWIAEITDLGVTSAKLAASAVTAGKIAAGAITNADLAAGSVTLDKLAIDARITNFTDITWSYQNVTNVFSMSNNFPVVPAFRATKSDTFQIITGLVETLVTFETLGFDTINDHVTNSFPYSTNTSKYVVPVSGVYDFRASIGGNPNIAPFGIGLGIHLNGVTNTFHRRLQHTSTPWGNDVGALIRTTNGAIVDVRAFLPVGGTAGITNIPAETYFEGHFISQ